MQVTADPATDEPSWPPPSWSLPWWMPAESGTTSNMGAPDADRAGDPEPAGGPSRARYRPVPAGSPDDGGHSPDLARPSWPRLIGSTLMILGGLMVLFAAFQLWGTAALEWRAQRQLLAQLDAEQATRDETEVAEPAPAAPLGAERAAGPATDANAGTGTGTGPTVDVRLPAAPMPAPVVGNAIGRIEIPALGLTKAMAEGVDRNTLRQGPGHYAGTPLPGHTGNTAIAGHRTTHGAPFYHLDELEPGDEIVLTTAEGEFRYQVMAQTLPDGSEIGHRIVDPGAVQVLTDQGDNRLTLTACHPRYSARERIVVTAALVGPPLTIASPEPPPASVQTDGVQTADGTAVDPDPSADDGDIIAGALPSPILEEIALADAVEAVSNGITVADPAISIVDGTTTDVEDDGGSEEHPSTLGWQHDALAPTVLWATICLLVAMATWIAGRLWRRRWVWGPGAVAIVPCLFVCFVHLDRLLPAL